MMFMNSNNNKPCPPVLSISGLKNSGKTTLIEAIIPLLLKEGIHTAVIKHHGHGFEGEIPDKPGTDTYRFLANGAFGTVVYDDDMAAIVKRSKMGTEELISLFYDADLIIIEGAKHEPWPRIAMLRTGQPLPDDTGTLLCVVTDNDYDQKMVPVGIQRFDFESPESVSAFILNWIASLK
jgi:molybdopterin-guanine dinucleotide biosynthesis protein MobB